MQVFQFCSFQIVLNILSPLFFHINFRISFSVSTKKPANTLTGILWIIKINLERIKSLTILSHPIYGYTTALFRHFFISLIAI